MVASPALVSVGLPVRNAGERVADVVRSVLAQRHEHLELVISDNASTDNTEEVCRELAAADPRIAYHRQPENIGLLSNFVAAINLARGEFFRWIGDDDRLEPDFVTRCLEVFAADQRLVLVTTAVSYAGPDGPIESHPYTGTALRSDDPVERFEEMLRLLNEDFTLIDPLYGMVRREPVAALRRRNMLREDEVFATRLALLGPWGHVPEVLSHRHWKADRIGAIANRLGVPAWQSHFSNTLQFQEILRFLRDAPLTGEQQRRCRLAVYRMYLRKQRRTAVHRGRKLLRLATLR